MRHQHLAEAAREAEDGLDALSRKVVEHLLCGVLIMIIMLMPVCYLLPYLHNTIIIISLH
jgi:hypothetical protein